MDLSPLRSGADVRALRDRPLVVYSTVFNPHVYPMNPSWLTGRMPAGIYKHEHPEHLAEARSDTEKQVRRELERLRARRAQDADPEEPPGPETKA